MATNESTRKPTEEVSVAEDVPREPGSKQNTEKKGVMENKMKMFHMQALAMKDSIAAGKAVLEQAAKVHKELLPANTETLPQQDIQSRIGSIIDASVNFGFSA